VVAVVLLGALVFCALDSYEAWPLSAWQLFSRVRTADQPGWAAAMVDGPGVLDGPGGDAPLAAGPERPLPFGRLPRGFHNAAHVLGEFPRLDDGERARICRAWYAALDGVDEHPAVIRVYRTNTRLMLDGRPPALTRTLYYQCPSR
jgi:hypothetical protein